MDAIILSHQTRENNVGHQFEQEARKHKQNLTKEMCQQSNQAALHVLSLHANRGWSTPQFNI